MPVVFRRDGLRYYFFSNEGLPPEPAHIHVKGGGKDAKTGSFRRSRSPIPTGSIGASFPLCCPPSQATAT